MKRIVKYISILSIMLCVFGFMTGVCADNEQGAVSSVAVEEQLSNMDKRLTEVEKLSKDELIEELLQNQRDITNHSASEMNVIGILVAIVASGIAAVGIIVPILSQKKIDTDFNKIKEEWENEKQELSNKQEEAKNKLGELEEQINELKGYTQTTEKKMHEYTEEKMQEMKAYTYFAMALNENDINKQIELYTKAIEHYTNYENAYVNRGVSYYDLGEYTKALADYNKAIELDPNDEIVYNNRGNTYDELSKNDCAMSDYNKAIDLNLNYAMAYFNRALLHKKMGNMDMYTKDMEMYEKLTNKDNNPDEPKPEE